MLRGTIAQLAAGGFVVITTAEVWQGELLLKTATISVITEDLFFANMIDQWARQRGVDWMARHIVEVQRKFRVRHRRRWAALVL